MKIKLTLLFILISLFLPGCNQQAKQTGQSKTMNAQLPNGKIIDLTYDFSDETVYWVTAKQWL